MPQDSTHQPSVNEILLRELIREKKSERRWKIFRFFVMVLLIVLLIISIATQSAGLLTGDASKGYVALIRLNGMIGPGEGFSAQTVLPLLDQAFTDKKAKGVVLVINSGGGTPVQAAIMHDAIIDLKKKYHKKVVVVGEDTMASGAYYVAVAADRIYVNPSSLTGSIGVIMKDFGFPELIKKVGIERRVYTSGANKDRLDPFLPQNAEDVKKIHSVINEIYENFREVVLQGRAGKLHGSPDALFSGDFWAGPTALKLGLVDNLGNLSDALTREFHVAAYRDYSETPSVLKNLVGQFGMSLGSVLNNHDVRVEAKI